MSDPMELGLQMAVSYCVGAGNRTLGPQQVPPCS